MQGLDSRARHAGRLSLLLTCLAVATGLGAGEPQPDRCKPEGRRCRTNQSCCTRRCAKAPGAKFGTCCKPITCDDVVGCGTLDDGCGGQIACPCPACQTISDAIATSDPTSTGALNTDGNMGGASVCSTPLLGCKPWVSGRHRTHTLVNGCGTACVTVRHTASCGLGGCLNITAYLGAYDPSTPCAHFIGQSSGSFLCNGSETFSFDVPPGAPFVLVAHDLGACPAYTLEVCCSPTTTTTTTTTTTSTTEVTPCSEAAFPTCGGACLGRLVCQSFQLINGTQVETSGCGCVDPDTQCSADCTPGVCPAGSICTRVIQLPNCGCAPMS